MPVGAEIAGAAVVSVAMRGNLTRSTVPRQEGWPPRNPLKGDRRRRGDSNVLEDGRATMKPQLAAFALAAVVLSVPDPGVTVKTFAFGPKTLEVTRGRTVTWSNADDIEHTVTSGTPEHPDGAFDHLLATRGATASVRFDSVGTWSYFCKRHSFMRGEIRVIPKGER